MATQLDELLGYGRDFAQGASNSAASTVSAPVDGIAWLLRKAGMDVGEPVGGSDWMARKGLTAQPKNALAGLLGESAGMVAPIMAAAKGPQIANALNQMVDNAAARPTLNPQTGAIVWHGTPHQFDKFDSSKIGTGEGAQAYGHGLYLAESPGVAQSYKEALSVGHVPDGWAGKYPKEAQAYIRGMVGDVASGRETPERAARLIGYANANMRGYDGAQLAKELSDAAEYSKGSLYKVDLPDSAIAKMLDWDKPLSEQAPEVRAAMEKYRMPPNASGRQIVDMLQNRAMSAREPGDRLPLQSYAKDASVALRQAGVPGIRYLDGGSRTAGQGSSNFVVFPGEENALRILERNGKPVP